MQQLFITAVRDFVKGTMGTVEAREVPLPEPADEEVRIRIIHASICGSDAHTLSGQLGAFEETTRSMLPMAFGHEFSGIIDRAAAGGGHRLPHRRPCRGELRQILLRLRCLPQRT